MKLKDMRLLRMLWMAGVYLLIPLAAFASEADLAIPDLHRGAPYTHVRWYKPMESPLLWRIDYRLHAGYQLISAPPGQEIESP